MTVRWDQVRTIFGAAIEIDPSAREPYVREVTGTDQELYAEVMSLLNADSDHTILKNPAMFGAHVSAHAKNATPSGPRYSQTRPWPEESALNSGTRLGAYEIIAPIDFGGMGRVYRARDLTLHRDVAIKVLPPEFETDPSRLERFRREATLLASLSHRNIAAVYGLHDTHRVPALVMELIEGPTLADRINEGSIPLKETLAIARQIAEALEAAHEQGIVHRDLKPANVKVRPDGEVKVLDFGIAKALDVRPEIAILHGDSSPMASPLTTPGVVLGSGRYMSPEQARGLAVDRRSDIWSFGVTFWEMLTGKPLFAGDTLSDIVASVLDAEPDWTILPPDTPAAIRRLLRRSLCKDRKLRLDSATVARLEIDEGLTSPEAPRLSPTRSQRLPWAVAGMLAVAMMLLLVRWAVTERSMQPTFLRVSAEFGADVMLHRDGPAVILSPDGRTLVLATAPTTSPSLLYVRRVDQLTATPLRGTENATNPFFSPDGRWIGFFAHGKLKRISTTGGTAVTVSDAPNGRGGTWTADDSIVFAPDNSSKSVLMRVPAAGGVPEPLTSLIEAELSHRWPQMLPGNRGVLYTSNTSDNWDNGKVMVQPLPHGTPKVVQPGFFGRYVASGHVLYIRSGTLYAAPFDLNQFAVVGPSKAVIEDVVADATTGAAQFAVSETGTLVFLQGRGRSYSRATPAVWMERGGNTLPLPSDAANWANPQISPDGNYLAYDISDGKQTDIWVQDLRTAKVSRLTFDPSDDFKPIWTRDGQRIAFTSTRDGSPNLYWQHANGTGDIERLTRSPNAQHAASWDPGGRFLAFDETRPATGRDVMILPLERNGRSGWTIGTPTAFAGEPFNETEPMFSPDGRWIAYHSNESGRVEVFVRPFNGGDGKWQVSSDGGRDATWSRARSELLYFGTTQNRIMVAPFTLTRGSFWPGSARSWSITQVGRPAREGRTFDLHPDGDRVVVVPSGRKNPDHMTLVFDFFDQLRQNVSRDVTAQR